jgi:hypothetical protein
MVCTTCYATFKSNLGETTKVRNSAWCGTEGDDDDDEDDGDGEQQFRRQKRCVHQLQLVLGALFAGNTFKSYQEQVIALNVNHLGEQAFSNTVYFIALFVRAATDKSIELMQYVMVRYGKIDDMITTSDTFWAYRGHHAWYGTTTTCAIDNGGVLAVSHSSKKTDKAVDTEAEEFHTLTSGAMDGTGFRRNMKKITKFIDEDSVELLEQLGRDVGDPAHSGAVLDGDAECHAILKEECPDTKEMDCINHVAKNCGKQIEKLGKQWQRACDCPIKLKADGVTPYADKVREHHGVKPGLVKAWQVSQYSIVQYCSVVSVLYSIVA